MRLTLSACADSLEGELIGEDVAFERVNTDTRHLQVGDLYVAISGERFDGHDFIAAAIDAGACAVVCSTPVADCVVPQLVVDDTRRALGRMAYLWRAQLSPTVVALTGSNGKTTTKEMLASIFSEVSSCFASPGNLNNDIGVPKSLFLLNEEHRYAVMELGANHSGEIAYLSKLVKPQLAMITNASSAHIEGFGSKLGVIEAKGEIYSALNSDGIAVINRDDSGYDYWRSLAGGKRVVSFGFHEASSVRGTILSPNRLRIEFGAEEGEVNLALLGQHNLTNALAAAAATLALRVPMSAVCAGLQKVQAVPGRLSSITLSGGVTVIDDSYNANPASVKAAIDVLASFENRPRWLLFGDMAELGQDAPSMHEDIGHYAASAGIEQLWSVGELSARASEAFGEKGRHFASHDALIEALLPVLESHAVTLFKGSRSIGMERAVSALCAAMNGEGPAR